jgi:hypothetical protein
MEKYKFNKDYETQIRAAAVGGTGTGTKQIKISKDTIVDGEVLSKGLVSISNDGVNLSVDASYLDLYKPVETKISDSDKGKKEDVKTEIKKESVKKVSTSVFTTKNIVIATIVIGGVFYFLKYKKII